MEAKGIGQIHHLIRYFFLLGVLAFVAFIKRWNDDLSLVIMGPALYLTYGLLKVLGTYVALPSSQAFSYYGFLMPITILYFSFIGFQIKQLWNEKGPIRFISLFALIGFLIYIHYTTFKNLGAYFAVPF
jgi:hypothetical protein